MAEFGKLNFSVSFQPTSAFPLDARCYFESLAAAEAAAATADVAGSSTTTYYYGETFVVVENSVATMYIVQPDKTLSEVGGNIDLNENAFIINADGNLDLYAFADAVAGAQLTKGADGKLSWVKPDTTTVEGLSTEVESLRTDVDALSTSVQANTAAIETLNGTGEGSVDKKVSDAVAAIVSGADESYDTLKEISDWISTHGTTAAEMNTQINTNKDNIAALTTDLESKVDKVEGSRLMTTAEGDKLAGLVEGAQVNVIDGVSSEFVISEEGKVLGIAAIDQSKITGLTDALAGKVDVVEGKGLSSNDFTNDLLTKINGIDEGANANILEVVKVNGTALAISEKSVDIPVASAEALGVVKSSTEVDKIFINAEGEMTVNSISASKIVQAADEVLILNGGSSN